MSVDVRHGDCFDVFPTLADCSVDAVVTDPPYDLTSGKQGGSGAASMNLDSPYGRSRIGTGNGVGGFMGKAWDSTGIAFDPAMWAEVLRVLKPGGHLLAFGGTRTHHRMMCAIEDAGAEIRDCLMWLYGSGFPKSLDVSKAIDKAAGAERAVVGQYVPFRPNPHADTKYNGNLHTNGAITAPATSDAARWDGWGTALKPAWEPIVLARKPLSESGISANVLRWGTGALNVDGCRIGTADNLNGGAYSDNRAMSTNEVYGEYRRMSPGNYKQPSGRWPANLVLSHSLWCVPIGTRRVKGANGGGMKRDGSESNVYGMHSGHAAVETVGYADADGYETVEAWECDESCPVRLLDMQSGRLASGSYPKHRNTSGYSGGLDQGVTGHDGRRTDAGGASRFFYVAKASRAERRGSKHPTVKPLALMRYLVRLVTPLDGVVLDPFAGSGTTAEACLLEGFGCIAIEREAEYLADIARRIEAAS